MISGIVCKLVAISEDWIGWHIVLVLWQNNVNKFDVDCFEAQSISTMIRKFLEIKDEQILLRARRNKSSRQRGGRRHASWLRILTRLAQNGTELELVDVNKPLD